jgi:hypothetical protein
MVDIGSEVEAQGWRQGSLLSRSALQTLAAEQGFDGGEAAMAIVISQSCDLTQRDLAAEPFAEVIIGRRIEKCHADFMYGKHPRCLHLPVQCQQGDEQTLALVPWQRRQFPRERLAEWEPDAEHYLLRADLQVLVTWLAQRYVRGALPDAFNNLLARKRKRWEKLRKKLSGPVSSLLVELNPAGELEPGQRYSVNLLALVPVAQKASLEDARQVVRQLAELMESLGMEVQAVAKAEDDVSYAVVRRMTRFPLEYLSLRGDPIDPLPQEFDTGGD